MEKKHIPGEILTTNREWNTKVVSTEQGEVAQEIVEEFEELWNSEHALTFSEFYENYKQKYEIIKRQREIAKKDSVTSLEKYKLQPNRMQVGFISNLRQIIEAGEERALLISATGTGKTYASAFAMRNEQPKKTLFIVHRELIAKQAVKSYRRVFGNKKKIALLSGNSKEYDADVLFATMSMMAKAETLERYKTDEFDWICIDDYVIIGLSQEAA